MDVPLLENESFSKFGSLIFDDCTTEIEELDLILSEEDEFVILDPFNLTVRYQTKGHSETRLCPTEEVFHLEALDCIGFHGDEFNTLNRE